MKEIDIRDIKESATALINDGWGLVAAGNEKGCNMMTVSWGAIGEMWSKDAVFIFVRPNRYTYEFLEKNPTFSLSFFDNKYHDKLILCGKKSGRDIDKIKETGFTPVYMDDTVAFAEAKYTIICKIMASQFIDPKGFIDPDIESNYNKNDYHKMYIGQIIKVIEN